MKTFLSLLCMSVIIATTGCAQNKTRIAEGTGIGAILGAAAGGIIGHQSGHGVGGALIGAAAGAATGAVVGPQVEKPEAEVEAAPATEGQAQSK